MTRVLQGMLVCTSEVCTSTKLLMSLWKHECTRVVADRFTTFDDKDWFEKAMIQARDIKRVHKPLLSCLRFI